MNVERGMLRQCIYASIHHVGALSENGQTHYQAINSGLQPMNSSFLTPNTEQVSLDDPLRWQ